MTQASDGTYVVTFVLTGPAAANDAAALLCAKPEEVATAAGATGFAPVENNTSAPSKGISGGAVAGIIIGVLLAVTAVGAVLFIVRRRSLKAKEEEGLPMLQRV